MIKEFFSVPDYDLSQESSVDPMGLQRIWTYYGQAIFGDKLTTITNDLRVFTFNLFHHHLINYLNQEYVEYIQTAKAYYKTWQTDVDMKTGILMFLEDLVTHVFYNASNADNNIEKLGILGISKAGMLYKTNTEDKIFLSANKRMGVLKNQLNLGMGGRYKGPMMSMQFFDRSFYYYPSSWEQAGRFLDKWQEASELKENLVKLITQDLLVIRKKDYPHISVLELKKNKLWKPISEGYLKCFGERKLQIVIKKYWKDKLGLSCGAPAALLYEIDKVSPDSQIEHEKIFTSAANQLQNEPEELRKVNNILSIEPFLSHSEYLLRYLAQPGIKNLNDEEKNIQLLRREIIAAGNFPINDMHPRLINLHNVMMKDSETTEWINGVLDYHKKIMEEKESNIWIELDKKNNFKHYYSTGLSDNINTVQKYLENKPWWHTYYLETLKSINQGLK